ncbi:hypothetical protein L0Y59_01710 [Candidatus Uhrbacteria bacterium]|nr:hypothetical protein [Candidatus Uhrbacteria bacterium]
MSIPLIYFLIAWLILLAMFALLALVSVVQMLRFGVAGSGTYVSTAVFLGVTAFVVGGVGLYAAGTDWSSTLDILLTSLL